VNTRGSLKVVVGGQGKREAIENCKLQISNCKLKKGGVATLLTAIFQFSFFNLQISIASVFVFLLILSSRGALL
jgi:hypothetical protein